MTMTATSTFRSQPQTNFTWSERVHPAIARLHFEEASVEARGRFDVRRGAAPWLRAIASILRLPPSGEDLPFDLRIERRGDFEIWHRRFGGASLPTTVVQISGDSFVERLGPIRLRYQMQTACDALSMSVVGGRLLVGPVAIGLPGFVLPRITARVVVADDGLILPAVTVLAPWGGLILEYRGSISEVRTWNSY